MAKAKSEQVVEPSFSEETLFLGSYEHTLDEKGRITFPVTFRSSIERSGDAEVVLTNFVCDGARCLDGFGVSVWRDFERKVSEKSRFDPKLRSLENYYIARAALCSLDAAGRINIPQHLRQYAGLERNVTFTKSLRGFRVWDSRVWQMVFDSAESSLLEDPSVFAEVDL